MNDEALRAFDFCKAKLTCTQQVKSSFDHSVSERVTVSGSGKNESRVFQFALPCARNLLTRLCVTVEFESTTTIYSSEQLQLQLHIQISAASDCS
jgi:hypothetical protein